MAPKTSKPRKPKKRHEAREKFAELIASPDGLERARKNLREAAEFCGCVHGTIIEFFREVDAGMFSVRPARKPAPPKWLKQQQRLHRAMMDALVYPIPLPDWDPGQVVKLNLGAQNLHQKLVARGDGTPFADSTLTDAEAMSPFEWVGAGSHPHLAKLKSQVSGREGELFRGFLRSMRT